MNTIELPWPPTANLLTALVRGKRVKTRAHREYVAKVMAAVSEQGLKSFGGDRLAVHVDVYPPDRRKRDIDNCFKAILDGLSYSKVYDDDSQIDLLSIARCRVEKGGRALVKIQRVDYVDHKVKRKDK